MCFPLLLQPTHSGVQPVVFQRADFSHLPSRPRPRRANMIRNALGIAVDHIFCLYQQHDSCVVID